jgi:hypothetical protein
VGTISTVALLVVVGATGIHDRLALTASGPSYAGTSESGLEFGEGEIADPFLLSTSGSFFN